MNTIDVSAWKKFKLCDIFEKITVKKIYGKANDFPTGPTGEYEIPLLTAGSENQGFARYAMRCQCPTILQNVISISANGANTGISFYQDKEFAVLQDAYAIRLRAMEIPSREVGLFLVACLNKLLHGNFDWSNKAGWNNIKNIEISLPVTAAGQPDWDYMQEYIAELEQERIAELEQYLVATGLNDYMLTDEDLAVLAQGCDTADAGIRKKTSNVRFERYNVSNKNQKGLFTCSRGMRLTKSERVNGDISLLTAGVGLGQGVAEFIAPTDKMELYKNSITIDMFGLVFYHNYEHYGDDNIHFLVNNDMSDEVKLFISTVISKQVQKYSYSHQFRMNDLDRLSIILPTLDTLDKNSPYSDEGFVPDWEYMAAYIRAIEKLVITDVVDFKDAFIAEAKRVVEAEEEV